MASDKLPAIQFYPADWKKDPSVQVLDLEHKGAWIELLFAMHDTSERGRLVLPNGAPIPDSAIAKMLGISEQRWKQMRKRLLAMGTASEDDKGVLYNRRMARDDALRRTRAEAGRRGGLSRAAKQKPSKRSSKTVANPSSSARAPAGASSASSVSSSASAGRDLPTVQQFQSHDTSDVPRQQQDGLKRTHRERAALIFRHGFHLGRDRVVVQLSGGSSYSENLDRAMGKWDRAVAAGADPEELNAELELVRVVESFPPEEPITAAVYFGKERHETRELCKHERLKREGPSRGLPTVELPDIPAAPTEDKQAIAKRKLAALRERENRASA